MISIGISSCLLGEKVRYDGDHSLAATLIEQLGTQFELISICPEMAIGMGVPRDPIQLVTSEGKIRVQGVADRNIDVTEQLQLYARDITHNTPAIYGYIFKSRSPSCGYGNTKIFGTDGELLGTHGIGIFADSITQMLPDLPVTDESQLLEQTDIEQFAEKVIQYHHKHRKIHE